MTDRSVIPATFVLERLYDAAPARVFAVFADPQLKARWMGCDENWIQGTYQLDFRVGGREVNHSGPPEGPTHVYEARYFDIVPDERIVLAYDLSFDARRISVSLMTVEFKPAGAGTRLVLTEQGVYLDGYDGAAEREEGTREGLERLAEYVREPTAA